MGEKHKSFWGYFMRVVAPMCIAAIAAMVLGLSTIFWMSGTVLFVATVVAVICGFWVGWKRGEQISCYISKTSRYIYSYLNR